MTELSIGSWVKREGAFTRRDVSVNGRWVERWIGPRWHLVESTVRNGAVVRCGKRMAAKDARARELQVSALMPLTRLIGQPQLCKAGCQDSVGDGAPEDDATAGQEDPVVA